MNLLKIAIFVLAGAIISLNTAKAEEPKNLVTILTAPDPQTQLMAMVLTMQSMQQKATVHILLCGPAGDLALKDAPASATAPQQPRDMSPQGLMRKIIENGAKVEVCAIYLPNKGMNSDVLIDGVGVAKPPEMASSLLGDNTRIMSF